MKLFRKKTVQNACCKDMKPIQQTAGIKSKDDIIILGSGCQKCTTLEQNTHAALEALGIQSDVTHITDFAQIASYGVMSTPALVIDERVVSYGVVLTKEQIIAILRDTHKVSR